MVMWLRSSKMLELMVVSKWGFLHEINWRGAWHVLYGWKGFPLGSMGWYNIQWIGPWTRKHFVHFFHRVQQNKSRFLKQKQRCLKQCVMLHRYIYQVPSFKFILLVRTLHNWHLYLLLVGDTTSTSLWVTHVLSPSK